MFARVHGLATAGETAKAAAGCRQILHADPTHPGAKALAERLAVASAGGRLEECARLLRAGRASEAERLLAPLAASQGEDFDVRHLLGVALLLRRDYQRALAHLDAAVRIRPRVPAAHNHRGQCLLALGKEAAALAAFERTLALAPGHSGAQANLRRAQSLVARHRRQLLPALHG